MHLGILRTPTATTAPLTKMVGAFTVASWIEILDPGLCGAWLETRSTLILFRVATADRKWGE